MIHLVVFVFQGQRFGVEARRVAEMGHVEQLPTTNWKQVDLTALCATRFTLKPAGAAECYLQFRGMQDATLLLLERRARLIECDAAQVWPLPTLLERAKQHPCIKAVAWYEGEPVLLLEPSLLPTL